MNHKENPEIYDLENKIEKFRLRDANSLYSGLLSPAGVRNFRKIMYDYFNVNKRDFPWRRTMDPYHILVSEVMLQQTQTERVAEKYVEFIDAFPSIGDLAGAPVRNVLAQWQGLGYNRRALMLHRLARMVLSDYDGVVPDNEVDLVKLPGIGKATAASISAFAFNKPAVFIETNIRTLYIFFFFNDSPCIPDSSILPLVAQTLDKKNPCLWYSALMDFGSMLKKMYPNPGRKSAHHQKQTSFEGSKRQLRGRIINLLLIKPGLTREDISVHAGTGPEKLDEVIAALLDEGFLTQEGDCFFI